jgi:hypothetical protein
VADSVERLWCYASNRERQRSLPKYRIDILLPREIQRQPSSKESQMEQHDFSRVGLVIASE